MAQTRVFVCFMIVLTSLMSEVTSHMCIITKSSVQLSTLMVGPYLNEEHLSESFVVRLVVFQFFRSGFVRHFYFTPKGLVVIAVIQAHLLISAGTHSFAFVQINEL